MKKKKKQGQREEEKSRLLPIFVCGFQNHLCSITCWTYIKLVICCALNRTIKLSQSMLAGCGCGRGQNSRFGFGHGIHARAETHKYRLLYSYCYLKYKTNFIIYFYTHLLFEITVV